MNGGETTTVINRWLLIEFKVLCEVKQSVDALLLREDPVGSNGLTDFVPPASFFWSTIDLVDFVELDRLWGTTIKLFCPFVLVEPISCCASTGVTGDVLRED